MATLSNMMASDQKASEETAGSAAISVTTALNLAKRSLEGIRVKVIGEVSEFANKPGYKAVYFTIKDDSSSLSCMIWQGEYRKLGIDVKIGDLVEVTGYFTLYAKTGRMNFMARVIEYAGAGDLRLKVERLAKQLEAEGLMRPERKRPIPASVERVAVVTSPRGKAIQDVLRTLRRRSPYVEVFVVGVPVEGKDAPNWICEGLSVADASDCDAILLVRGGGSYESLMPFNDEQVARAVAACAKPVVTGIGHEPDNSIADMVGDVRCSTPTAAAEAVAPSIGDLQSRIASAGSRMGMALQAKADRMQMQLSALRARPIFIDPQALTGNLAMRIDADAERLHRAIPNAMASDERSLANAKGKLASLAPRLFERQRNSIALSAARLNDLSPLTILGRGYSIAYDDGGHILKSIDGVNVSDSIQVRVSDGTIDCTVEGIGREEA